MSTNFNLNTLKGRLVEQLIKDLYINNGYNVLKRKGG